MDTPKVAVIGAGPAGSAAAIRLAQDGIEVSLFEAACFPRHRPGESLHPGVGPIFEKLGVAGAIDAAGFHRHPGIEILWGEHSQPRFEPFGRDEGGPWLGYQAWRPDLDGILLEQARSLGADCHLSCKVHGVTRSNDERFVLTTGKGTFEADFLLDASGRNAFLGRQFEIGWQTHSPPQIARYGYFEGDFGKIHDLPKIKSDVDGWTWIAGINAHRCAWVRLRFDGRDPGADWLPLEFRDCGNCAPGKGADVTWRIARKVAGPRWFLLGDAAAVLDPSASHGVLRALMTGMQAAHLIGVSYRRTDWPPDRLAGEYQAWLESWFHHDVQRLRELRKMV